MGPRVATRRVQSRAALPSTRVEASVNDELIEGAARAAGEATGLAPGAILPAIVRTDLRLFVCALGEDEVRRWIVVDDAGAPVRDPGIIRDAVEIVAISEIAEEAVALLSLHESRSLIARTLELATEMDETEAAVAARATEEALAALAEVDPAGVRVASAAHLDAISGAAGLVGDRFDLIREAAMDVSAKLSGEAGDPRDELAKTIWDAVRMLARDGPPDKFKDAIENGLFAASALADDVLAHYAVELD